jgi:hypothetical protein
MTAKKTAAKTVKTPAKAKAPPGTSVEARVAALERSIRVLATSLYAPNGGGPEHVEEARELFEALVGGA